MRMIPSLFLGLRRCKTVTALVRTCQLDLTGLPTAYVGGQLTTNTLASRTIIGADTDPPCYPQLSIATVRLWTKGDSVGDAALRSSTEGRGWTARSNDGYVEAAFPRASRLSAWRQAASRV
jgi:hypothetical protein